MSPFVFDVSIVISSTQFSISQIKHLKISGRPLQPFSAFQGIFLSDVLDRGLLRTRNTKRALENPSEDWERLQKPLPCPFCRLFVMLL